MAAGFYMNLELLALEIADDHITKMTDYTNEEIEHGITSFESIHNNIKNGLIVVVMLNNYVESLLNSILRDCIYYEGERLLKVSIEDKLEIVYMHYKADISVLRGFHLLDSFKRLSKLRNDLIHYKDNNIGWGTGLPLQGSSKTVFGKALNICAFSTMKRLKTDIIGFCNKVLSDCGLAIFQWCELFSCDARDGNASYVYDKRIIDFDEDRLSESPSDAYLKYVCEQQ